MGDKVPELPPMDEIKKRPSRDEFDRKMKEMTAQALKWKEQSDENRLKRQMIYDGGKVDGSNVTYRDLLSKDIEEIKKHKNQRREQIDRVKELNTRQRELDN